MKKYIERMNEEGFTLIELVVAVSILLILTVSGAAGYSAMIDNNRKNTMELTATAVMNKIMSNIMDYDDRTSVKTALDTFNEEVNNGEFNIYTIVDGSGCVNVVVEDNNNRVDPVYRTQDRLCNLSDEQIG